MMNLEEFLNWSVSIDCGLEKGIYQGQIESVDLFNQNIRLKNVFHNGIPFGNVDQSYSIVLQAKEIHDLKLLSPPQSNLPLIKSNSKKYPSEQRKEQMKSISFNNQNFPSQSIVFNGTERKTSSDFEQENNEKDFLPGKFSFNSQEKYRCDQMILEHNNEPIDYQIILLPFPTTKKYLTDEGLIIPSITWEFRDRLFSCSELFGYSIERRIESMGRSTSDMLLHLLGGTQRLAVKNRHQHPILVVLASSDQMSGIYAICAARILATKNISIYLYVPNQSSTENLFFQNELKLFRTTNSIVTDQIEDLPRSPVDLVLNGLDLNSISDYHLIKQIEDYCSQLQTSLIGIDPKSDMKRFLPCKYSLVPLLPIDPLSSKHVGRIYLCDLTFGKAVFQHLQIRYQSPFGAKSFLALHEN